MKLYTQPSNAAGMDVLISMEVDARESMRRSFSLAAERDYTKIADHFESKGEARSAEETWRVLAKLRNMDGAVTFHAGVALERALNLVHAYGTDSIRSRSNEGRKSHGLVGLLEIIGKEINGDVGAGINDVFSRALEPGLMDIKHGVDMVGTVSTSNENRPFYYGATRSISAGMEYTADENKRPLPFIDDLFAELPKSPTIYTMHEFLEMADKSYESLDLDGDEVKNAKKNMRWNEHSGRDHRVAAPYLVAGTHFFTRLVLGLLKMAKGGMWFWHSDLLCRWADRRQEAMNTSVKNLLRENYEGNILLPQIRSGGEYLEKVCGDLQRTRDTTREKRRTLSILAPQGGDNNKN